jgi:Zn-dependent peptidase ImmA (M78 family)/DNA-binding XRE family transcriptional regulator
MTGKIIPARIVEAREARSMSMEDLANGIGVTRQSISKYEKGIISPSHDTLKLVSCILDFPLEFFYKAETEDAALSSPLFFRSNSNIAKKSKTASSYQVKWVNEAKRFLERYFDFVDINLPTIDADYEDLTDADIEELALSIRKQWGLAGDPIRDLIGLLENNGIIVSQFSTNSCCPFKGIDAFSSWRDGTPYIMYHPTQKSAVRTRFSILHELGHLIMHSSIAIEDSGKKSIVDFADMQADRFAAAFLLPSTSFPTDIHGSSLASLEAVKKKWGAAMSTIIRRCTTLGLLSENQINYLNRQMTIQKYWHKEPLDDVLTVAEPEILRDAVYVLIDSRIITKDSFLNSSGLSASDLQSICGLPDDFFNGIAKRQKPVLRVVNPT